MKDRRETIQAFAGVAVGGVVAGFLSTCTSDPVLALAMAVGVGLLVGITLWVLQGAKRRR
ncbi:hypothetical protein AB0O91_28660 [Kitasatospora sp. NPDC089797]|uniref:hypothetical protein n=1 Tax=Kitasatospora sp. NPDC089797 TaxID=3155298 RepID=UPI003437293C